MGSCVSSESGKAVQWWNSERGSMEEETTLKSESKGVKRGTPYMRGAATSFGFRRANKSSSKLSETAPALGPIEQAHDVTPTEPPGLTTVESANGAGVRVNRFGFRSASAASNGSGVPSRGVTNKVADSSSKKQRPSVFLADSKRPGSGAPVKQTTPTPPPPPASISLGPGARPLRCSPRASAPPASAPAPAPPCNRDGPRPTPPSSIPGLRTVKGPVSHLPRPQFLPRTVTRDVKSAKSAVNHNTRGFAPIATFDDEICSSKESSLNEDSGLGSQVTGDTDTLHGVEVLDSSPRSISAQRARRGIAGVQIRSLKEDEDDPNVITEILPIALPNSVLKKSPSAGLGQRNLSPLKPVGLHHKGSVRSAKSASSDEFHDDLDLARDYGEDLDDRDDRSEEKVYRDHRAPEKIFLSGRCMKDYGPDEEQDDDWGHGEAMAENEWKEGLSAAVIDDYVAAEGMKRLLSSEGQNLAELVAASSEHGLIEDESAPEDSLFSSSPPSTSEDSPSTAPDKPAKRKVRTKKRGSSKEKDASLHERGGSKDEEVKPASNSEKKDEHLLSPEGSGTPSNSFSLSDGRDFLIDDEIGDQPALTIQNRLRADDGELELPSLTESTASLTICDSSRKQVPESRASKAPSEATVTDSPRSRNREYRERDASIDTLSPCASIASDDLIMDFDCGVVDEAERQLRSLDAVVNAEMDTKGDVLREWSSLMDSFHKDRDRDTGVAGSGRSRLLRSRASLSSGNSSLPDSPRSSGVPSGGSSNAPSPLRPPRQLASSDSDESAMMKVDRGTYQHMYQDVVHIKTMLLKLKRVLQEAETLNPFETSLKNGFLHQLVHADGSDEEEGRSRNPQEEVVDLKRQMVLMKQQMEEKDRTIQLMQLQMMKYERVAEDVTDGGDTCNAATQTERVRPVSAGPSLLQSLPCDPNGTPLVSWTDTWGRRSRTPAGVNSGGGNGSSAASSKVPTIAVRSSRSTVPGHQRFSLGVSGETPSNIPLVKSSSRKTGSSNDSVPNARRPPTAVSAEKSYSLLTQKP